MTKNKGCSFNVKLKQMVAWTCKKHICFNRMMKTKAGDDFSLCLECKKLYSEGRQALRFTLLGIGEEWRMRRLYDRNG